MWEVVRDVEGLPLLGLLQHMLDNGAMVYQSQDGRYRAEGHKALRT